MQRNRNKTYKQGLFTPRHPEKYMGDATRIIFRSSWELEFNKFLDNNPNVIRWASEELAIPYIKPTDGRVHRYFVDYFVEFKDKNGSIQREIIEVKPSNQTRAPKKTKGKKAQTYIDERMTYEVNKAKWLAADAFAKEKGWKFRIITEKEMFR